MKVYLVELDNGEQWEDRVDWIEKVFSNHQSAYDWLWNQGYRIEEEFNLTVNEEPYWTKEGEYGYELGAIIKEMEVED